MALIETEETNQFTFEAFAGHPFSTELNRALVRHTLASLATRPPNATLTIVDMACGTGAVTRLIAQEIARQGRQAHIIGVDPSAEALRCAQRSIEEIRPERMRMKVDFIQGEATDLPYLTPNADAAFFCNAIHLLPDKLSTFRLMASILAPEGIFACNSGFYHGTYVEGTERFYRLWTSRAVRLLRKEHPEVQLSRETKAMAMQWRRPGLAIIQPPIVDRTTVYQQSNTACSHVLQLIHTEWVIAIAKETFRSFPQDISIYLR